MLITETQTVKQFLEDDKFESTLSFSLDDDDIENWVVVENDAQELSLSLVNWKKLVELANKVINQYEKKQNMENNILKNNTIINKEVNPLIFTEEDMIDTTKSIKNQELNLSIFTREELEQKIYILNDYINKGIEKIKSQYSELNIKDNEIANLKKSIQEKIYKKK